MGSHISEINGLYLIGIRYGQSVLQTVRQIRSSEKVAITYKATQKTKFDIFTSMRT
jgi:hypothetical protein